jgi:hypothetical protein
MIKTKKKIYLLLDLEQIDTGKGKRVVISNGVLDKKYLITVPREGSV